MKKALSLFLATLIVFATMSCLSVVAFGAEVIVTEVEDNDTVLSAQEIFANTTTTGLTDSSDDVDWYKFESTNDYFTINLRPTLGSTINTTNGWFMYLYDENFNGIKSYYHSLDTGYTNIQTAEIPYSGTIYVKIVPYSSRLVDIHYNLTVCSIEDEHWENEFNDTKATANAIKTNEAYFGSANKSADEDWYKFESDKNYFKLKLSPNDVYDSNKGWFLYIYDVNNNEIKSYYHSLNTGYTNISTNELAYTGTIYVKIVPYSNDVIDVNYTLKIETHENLFWENENNNTSTTANEIKQGSTYKGTLMSANDVDYYKFQSTSNAFKIKFDIDGNETSLDAIGGGWKISVYPADSAASIVDEYLVQSEGSFETITLPYEKGKEYFIKVVAKDSNAPIDAIYNISAVDASNGNKWEVENGKFDLPSATTINNGDKIYGNIYTDGDKDYYKLFVPADGKVKVSFNRTDSEYAGAGWQFTLVDGVGSKVNETVNLGNSLNATWTSNKSLKEGNYYIVMECVKPSNAPSPTIDYNITVTYTMNTPQLTGIANASNGVTVKWSKVEDCAGYYVYRKAAGEKSWSRIATVKGDATVSYKDTKVSSGKSYTYTVKAYDGKVTSSYNKNGVSIKFLATPKLSKVTSAKNGITFSWGKVTGATGYIVYRKTGNGSWQKIATVKGNTKVSYLDKTAKKGVTYTYTVRAYYGTSTSYYNTKGLTIKDKY